ncbi:MAG: hypothetical protein AB1465_03190 [Patescibacteria group bacterium]
MNEQKWEELKSKIKKQFGIENEGEEKEDEKETKWIEFNGAQGKMRLEYVIKPKTLGVKTLYSKRSGTSAYSEKPILSQDEKVQFLKAYKKEGKDWVEIKMPL